MKHTLTTSQDKLITDQTMKTRIPFFCLPSFCRLILTALLLTPLAALHAPAQESLREWKHSGTLAILTTPDGANLPASARVEGFPLLVRLSKETFDFSQAQPNGEDVRFSAEGKPLALSDRHWDAKQGLGGDLGARAGHQGERTAAHHDALGQGRMRRAHRTARRCSTNRMAIVVAMHLGDARTRRRTKWARFRRWMPAQPPAAG